jgi:hypothetical protein
VVFLIRGLVLAVLIVALALFAVTIKIGERTTVEHLRRIWGSDEAQEMVQDVKREAGPVVERVKRGVTAGAKAAADSDAAREVADKAKREVADKVDQATSPIDAGPPDAASADRKTKARERARARGKRARSAE